MNSVELLAAAYDPLIAFAAQVDEPTGWTPTQLPGWTVRDLLFHLATDCQRALAALASPSTEPPDTDEVSYWSAWRPATDAAQAGLRAVRIAASTWTSVRGPAGLFVEAARAVLVAAGNAEPGTVVTTQGRTLTVDSLLRTLCVEATVHHLDLEPALAQRPLPPALDEVRRVLDALLGTTTPTDWEVIRYIRIGTGRLPLKAREREALGPLADRIPLFG